MIDEQQNLTSVDSDFEARIKSSLDTSIKHIDNETQHRLQAMRKLALTQLNKDNESYWQRLGNKLIAHWQPSLAGFAFCSIMLLLVFAPLRQHLVSPEKLPSQQAGIVDLLDNPDDLDVLGDPGFYVWVNELDDEKTSLHAS